MSEIYPEGPWTGYSPLLWDRSTLLCAFCHLFLRMNPLKTHILSGLCSRFPRTAHPPADTPHHFLPPIRTLCADGWNPPPPLQCTLTCCRSPRCVVSDKSFSDKSCLGCCQPDQGRPRWEGLGLVRPPFFCRHSPPGSGPLSLLGFGLGTNAGT
ncbi:hypothetical protein LY78DRAFT_384037 [Colletotrichum sublineola]|nr:hypothetical protein LY78DRAFT_384037 [Colletotrichum sublineola]